jgi:Putative Actinobacterial Holin-X, holin superfamily III
MNDAPAESARSIPELLKKLAEETSLLVRQEAALARAEILKTITEAGRPAAGFGVAAILGIGSFGALTTVIIAAIALALPLWASALIVTMVYGLLAAVAAMWGRSAYSRMGALFPAQTMQTIKQDITEVHAAIERGR